MDRSDLQRSQQHAKREAQELERELEERREQSEAAAAAKERVARKHAENDELARALQAVQMQESQLRAQVLAQPCQEFPASSNQAFVQRLREQAHVVHALTCFLNPGDRCVLPPSPVAHRLSVHGTALQQPFG